MMMNAEFCGVRRSSFAGSRIASLTAGHFLSLKGSLTFTRVHRRRDERTAAEC
jgi:hypothetical protein